MNREYRTIPSETLGHPMEILVFGHSGKPMLVFPSQEGRFFDYENFGMLGYKDDKKKEEKSGGGLDLDALAKMAESLK